eukprot:NODE_9776_length_565_cov_67.323529_g9138_i0.p1 GENE.NODE_9776_length_565_cov_67.323529_g9138_i0~~NODE_9776_length_565_cov_67.323529_g9138_i0.p1  ORF type:complete len:167 (+),score=34.90 NODE_9776_length_565_cov_67.323529_g9138_i0:58-501(+)
MTKKAEVKTSDYPKRSKSGKAIRRPKSKIKLSPVRLHVSGVVLGYRRSLRNQTPNRALLAIKNVNTKDEAKFYVGKRVVFVHMAKKAKRGVNATKAKRLATKTARRIHGKIVRVHGNSGAVKAKFSPNLPGQAIGQKVRVFLYPSSI